MKGLVGKILIGALAVSVPVGGAIYFVTQNNSNEEKEKNTEVEKKDNDTNTEKDKEPDKKNDNEKHPGTDAYDENEHTIKINGLKEEYNNDEVVGYIYIPNTSISEAVVQHSDNDYYLDHSAKKEKNTEGAIYLDYRTDINSGRKNIIYGHNGNSENLNVPFSELEKYYDKAFYDQNQYIYLEDEKGVGKYQIFSVFVETHDSNYMYLNFKNDSSWLEHITYLKNKSMYDTGIKVDSSDDILVLQTCSHNEQFAKYKDKYLVVVAKRVLYS